jgi:hypothetical protein
MLVLRFLKPTADTLRNSISIYSRSLETETSTTTSTITTTTTTITMGKIGESGKSTMGVHECEGVTVHVVEVQALHGSMVFTYIII